VVDIFPDLKKGQFEEENIIPYFINTCKLSELWFSFSF